MNYGCMDGPPYAPQCLEPYVGPIPAIPHLPRPGTPPLLTARPSSGLPPNGITGKDHYTAYDAGTGTAVFQYLNTQEPGTLWFVATFLLDSSGRGQGSEWGWR